MKITHLETCKTLMKTFTQFIGEVFNKKEDGTYVAINFQQKTVDELVQLFSYIELNENAKRLEPEDLHTTLMYCPTGDYVNVPPSLSGLTIRIYDAKLDLFGENKNILVLSFKSTVLNNRFKEIKHKHGLTSTYPNYKPHITIAEDVEEFGLKKEFLEKLENFDVLYIDKEYSEKIKD